MEAVGPNSAVIIQRGSSTWEGVPVDCDREPVALTLENLQLEKDDAAFQAFRDTFVSEAMVPSDFEYDTDYESDG
jgi:hypothetical protein